MQIDEHSCYLFSNNFAVGGRGVSLSHIGSISFVQQILQQLRHIWSTGTTYDTMITQRLVWYSWSEQMERCAENVQT